MVKGSLITINEDRETYLSNEAFQSGELIDGDSHLGHVVGHVGRAAERVGGDGVG